MARKSFTLVSVGRPRTASGAMRGGLQAFADGFAFAPAWQGAILTPINEGRPNSARVGLVISPVPGGEEVDNERKRFRRRRHRLRSRRPYGCGAARQGGAQGLRSGTQSQRRRGRFRLQEG